MMKNSFPQLGQRDKFNLTSMTAQKLPETPRTIKNGKSVSTPNNASKNNVKQPKRITPTNPSRSLIRRTRILSRDSLICELIIFIFNRDNFHSNVGWVSCIDPPFSIRRYMLATSPISIAEWIIESFSVASLRVRVQDACELKKGGSMRPTHPTLSRNPGSACEPKRGGSIRLTLPTVIRR